MRRPPNAVKNARPNSNSCICFCQRKDLQACTSDSLGKDPFRSIAGRKVESRVLNMWRVVHCAKISHSEVHTTMQSHLANFQDLHCSYLQWPLGSVLQHLFSHKDREGWVLLRTRHVTWTCLSKLPCALPPNPCGLTDVDFVGL